FNSQDYNLIGNTTGATFTGTTTHNIVNTNANLGILQNNGGPTFTHALLVGSLAIDAGGDLTTLSAAVDNLATTINVTDASAFPVGIGFVIQIDSEQMIVTGKTNNALTVTIAATGTISAAHKTGAGMNPRYY